MNQVAQKIFIIDDEVAVIESLNDYLEREHYQIYSALDGKQAIEMLPEIQPDLILLDVMLPQMDGVEVCRRIKNNEKTKSIPVVIITGFDGKEERINALLAGANDFLCKPVEPTELLLRIRSLLKLKSYQEKLIQSYREIADNQRMKEELAHMIIHDLNNPLFAISLRIESLLFGADNFTENQVSSLKECILWTNELETQIQNILSVYKMEVGQVQLHKGLTDVDDLVNGVLDLFKPRIEVKKINVSVSESKGIDSVLADSNLLKRVIANLFGNAIRHTPVGGNIEISVEYREEEKDLLFRISDSGGGIDPEFHQSIFDKFKQIDMKKSGSMVGLCGLGLPFCKIVVEAHEGKIWVDNKIEEAGAVFSFTIPKNNKK